MREILVIAEHRQGKINEITFEMVHLANQLGGDDSKSVSLLYLGHGDILDRAKLETTCDRLVFMDAPELKVYSSDYYLAAIEQIIAQRNPEIIILGHTSQGMDLAPALSVRTKIPLMTDCLEVSISDDKVSVKRQLYSGKIESEIELKEQDAYMVSLRPGCYPDQVESNKESNLETVSAPSWNDLKGRKFIEYILAEAEDVDITEADILVSVGRGIGKPENLPVIETFAESIGATVSCSRPVADKNWLPKSRQVGTSGKTVKPKIYIALGISGAFQHQAGMKNADTIIAVNTDPAAPIFGVADYGIIGDLLQVVPALTEKFR